MAGSTERAGAGRIPIADLLLASASPRRREILTRLGVDFDLVVPDVRELREGDPDLVVIENARRKARAGRRQAGSRVPTLGVDTDVALDGRLLGKPADERQARQRLEALSGRTHEVLSGLVLVDAAGDGEIPVERSGISRTEVSFHELDPATIDLYVGSQEWRGRAGGYAVQGLGSILVERLAGDLSNVIGLPIALLLQLAPHLRKPRAQL